MDFLCVQFHSTIKLILKLIKNPHPLDGDFYVVAEVCVIHIGGHE